MVSTFTTARNLEKPAAGDQVGTWGTATVNPNMDVIDAALGQTATISGAAGNVVLASNQYRCAAITFNSTLVGSISVTFPTSITGSYTIHNVCTGSSAFIITLQTTAAGGEAIACKPGEPFDIWNDGTNIRFRNLGHVGSYWDYAGSSVPNWVSGCSKPPYLNCDGTVFSSATYPQLAVIMAGTTLPDLRGRVRAYLNQGTSRLTSSLGGVDGNTLLAAGGAQTTTLSSQQLPSTALALTDPGHYHRLLGDTQTDANARGLLQVGPIPTSIAGNATTTAVSYSSGSAASGNQWVETGTTNVTATFGSTTPAAFTNLPPTAIGGLTLIRAA